MSTQQFQFQFTPPRSRRSDPLSSHRAEQRMRDSGALKGQCKITYELVKQYPGRTSKELASLGSLDRYQLARRLPELLEMKKITRIESAMEDCRWWTL